ncbi:MAG TPA: GNAT family N-acetyltransferase [Firmicutes bacterium]|nr:GNAT family N-acetyltransferase [Bacillota bacterium]
MPQNDNDIVIVNYKPEHQSRIEEITLEAFQGVSIDYLAEQKLGVVPPGWGVRKVHDIRRCIKAEPEGVFVALDGDIVAGYVTVETSAEKKVGRIIDLAVDSAYRRRGIGSQLIRRGLEYMKEKGMLLAKIETLETNEAGMAAYPKLGFREVVRQIHYYMPI